MSEEWDHTAKSAPSVSLSLSTQDGRGYWIRPSLRCSQPWSLRRVLESWGFACLKILQEGGPDGRWCPGRKIPEQWGGERSWPGPHLVRKVGREADVTSSNLDLPLVLGQDQSPRESHQLGAGLGQCPSRRAAHGHVARADSLGEERLFPGGTCLWTRSQLRWNS